MRRKPRTTPYIEVGWPRYEWTGAKSGSVSRLRILAPTPSGANSYGVAVNNYTRRMQSSPLCTIILKLDSLGGTIIRSTPQSFKKPVIIFNEWLMNACKTILYVCHLKYQGCFKVSFTLQLIECCQILLHPNWHWTWANVDANVFAINSCKTSRNCLPYGKRRGGVT